MSRAAENTKLYAATLLLLVIGSAAFMLPAPADEGYQRHLKKLWNGCFRLNQFTVLDRTGCFELQEDVVLDRDDAAFLFIRSSDVTVDLKGHTVRGPGQKSIAAAIYVETGDNVTIRNGHVSGFMFGIRAEPGANSPSPGALHIEHIDIVDASVIGIKLEAASVSISNTSVSRSGNVEAGRKFEYVNDLSVKSSNCNYQFRREPGGQSIQSATAEISLPESCSPSGY